MDINWHSENLSLETKISRSYKSTQNVRRFFKEYTSKDVHFSREFMAWMKSNTGKTLKRLLITTKHNNVYDLLSRRRD